MGRYSAKKKQDEKRKKGPAPRKAVEYTTSSGRGKNRVAKPRGLSNIPPGEGTGKGSPNDKKPVPAGKVSAAPTPTPKATAPKATAPKATSPKAKPSTKVSSPKKTAPKKPAATSTKKLTPMQQWAKANPGLAKKVKKGQSGYKELKIGRSTKKRTWLDKNYKPGK